MRTYSTREGDMLDMIVLRHYGALSPDMLQHVFEANRGLAAYGPILPAGVSVVLPDIEQPASTVAGVSLWD